MSTCVCVSIYIVCVITLSQAFVGRVRQADKPDGQTLIGKPLNSGRLHRKLHGLYHHTLSTLKSIARSICDYGTWSRGASNSYMGFLLSVLVVLLGNSQAVRIRVVGKDLRQRVGFLFARV